MSSLSEEAAVASPSASFETLSDAWAQAFGYIEKLTELNLRAFKSTLAENQAIVSAAISINDAPALFALQARRAQAVVEEAQSYWRHVYNITFSAQADLAGSAEARFRQRQHDVQALVDAVANSAPVAAVNALQSAVTTASEATRTTIEASKKAAQQALEIAENNANAASASAKAATQAVEQAGVITKK